MIVDCSGCGQIESKEAYFQDGMEFLVVGEGEMDGKGEEGKRKG